jgi:hypothetical protein
VEGQYPRPVFQAVGEVCNGLGNLKVKAIHERWYPGQIDLESLRTGKRPLGIQPFSISPDLMASSYWETKYSGRSSQSHEQTIKPDKFK